MDLNNIWEQMALRYETSERVNDTKMIVQKIRSQLKETSLKTALDYGCGTGLIGLGLIDLFASMLFVDSSSKMLEQVNLKLKTNPKESARTLCVDLLDAIPPGLSIDYIIMAQVLLHIPNTQLILSQLFEVLKPDGHLIIVDFDKNEDIISDKVHNGFIQSELKDLLQELGFQWVESETFYHRAAMFMNKDASMFILHCIK